MQWQHSGLSRGYYMSVLKSFWEWLSILLIILAIPTFLILISIPFGLQAKTKDGQCIICYNESK